MNMMKHVERIRHLTKWLEVEKPGPKSANALALRHWSIKTMSTLPLLITLSHCSLYMGRKRSAEIDDADLSRATKRRKPSSEDYDSDESLHLPEEIFGEGISSSRKRKKKKHRKLDENGLDSPGTKMHSVHENERENCDVGEFGADFNSSGRNELYLVRKPIEISLEKLSESRIPFRSCFSKDERVVIGDKCFTAHGTNTTTQMFHIPAEVIHSSENPWFTGVDNPIKGIVVLSPTDFCNSTVVAEEDGSTPDFVHDLPFKVIRRKVSRKSIRHLKQRLRANGVRND
uniref:Uncharacterized protein n=1 Tax=Angiostrongylus cantonensis TaxID=6313 RepID=A0A0K0DF70_ANGCA